MDTLLRYAKNPNHYYSQMNNPTDEMDRKKDEYKNTELWLQTCGSTAIVNILASQGHSIEVKTPGKYKPQPEEVLNDYFNDPRNYAKLRSIRKATPPQEWIGNEVPQFYPQAIKDVFNIHSQFSWTINLPTIKNEIDKNHGIMVTLKKPGHYIAIVGYDDKDNIIYNDPWPENYYPEELKGSSGHLRRYPYSELIHNMKPYKVIVLNTILKYY